MPVQQHMEQAVLADLRPTQMTVGAAEVAVKRSQWAQLKPASATSFCKATGFPPCAGRADASISSIITIWARR